MKLYIVRGLPGSGKSTLAKTIFFGFQTAGHCGWFEADQYFVNGNNEYVFVPEKIKDAHAWCQRETESVLSHGGDVVVSNTFTTKKELRPYFELAKKYGIVPSVFLCQNQFGNVHSVPEEALKRMKDRFEYDISDLFKEFE